jgi:hypothetical protein
MGKGGKRRRKSFLFPTFSLKAVKDRANLFLFKSHGEKCPERER